MTSTQDKSSFLRAEAELALEQSRKAKAERTKDLGSPIKLSGLALGIEVRGNTAWLAENTSVIRKINLENGKTLQVFRAHTAPTTCLALCEKVPGSNDDGILISGAWDKMINIWDVKTKTLVSSTLAHADFVKSLLVIPSLKLLLSSSSDKVIRFWDLSSLSSGQPLRSVGSISAHTRPVESITFDASLSSTSSAIVYTADTMGIIKVWEVSKEDVSPPRFRATEIDELKNNRTGVNEMYHGNGQLWTASSDETVQIIDHPVPSTTTQTKPIPPIVHPKPVRAILPISLTPLAEPYLLTGSGDVIRVYDMSTPQEPDLVNEVDAHWHDVTALRLWMRKTAVEGQAGKVRVEPWVISTSLDGTIRKWNLLELLQPPPPKPTEPKEEVKPEPVEPEPTASGLTEEEERELAELMDD